jgi:HSP20 family protein
MDRLFDSFLSDWTEVMPVRFRHDWEEWQGAPRVDVTDRGKEFLLRAEVPGFSREDLHVDVSESSVSLRGERKEESAEEGECYVCRESAAGTFERTISLPEEIRAEGVTAQLKEGVLTLTLPKVREEHRREIPVTEG